MESSSVRDYKQLEIQAKQRVFTKRATSFREQTTSPFFHFSHYHSHVKTHC